MCHFPKCFLDVKCSSTVLSLCYEKRIYPLLKLRLKAISFCGFYPRPQTGGLLLDPILPFPWHQIRDKYPRTPCPDAMNRLWWCRGNPCQLLQSFHHTHSYKSYQRHSVISLMLILACLPCSFSLSSGSPPNITACVKQGVDFFCSAIPPSIRELQGPEGTKGEQCRSSGLWPWRL